MNEKIKGLWWQAQIGYNNQNCDSEVLEKFAELLEKEFEPKYFSAGYIAGVSDGTVDTVRECVDREELMGAIARGWCSEKNSHKAMDSDLAEAIFDEVSDQIKKRYGVAE